MEKQRVGKTEISVSPLGVGCWSFGGGSYWGEQSKQDVQRVVHTALDRGVNYFDTAEVYNDGASERALGEALKGRRDEAVIGTKVSTSNVRPMVLRRHCEDSLRRLQTDYIDIYMLHWPVNPSSIAHFSSDAALIANPPEISEVMDTMMQLQKEGKIRAVGVSNHGVIQMQEALAACPELAVNELPYNLISRGIEHDILPMCREHNISVFGYMAYQQGILAGRYREISEIPPPQAHSRHFHCSRGGAMSRHTEQGAEREITSLLGVLNRLSDELGVSMAVLSLSWAMRQSGVANTLVGSRNAKQFLENLSAAEYRIPDDAYETLCAASQPVWDILGDNPDYYQNREDSRVW